MYVALQIIIGFLFPTQLTAFFFPLRAFIDGVPVDYLAYRITMLECVVIAHLLLHIYIHRKLLYMCIKPLLIAHVHTIVASVILLVFHLWHAYDPIATGIAILRIGLIVLWAYTQRRIQKSWLFGFMIGLVTQIFLVMWQISLQSAVGGLWWLLGERWISASTPGAALISFAGSAYLRPFGTFSHPNVMGGWAVIALIMLSLIHTQTLQRQASIALLGIIIAASCSWWAYVVAGIYIGYRLFTHCERYMQKVFVICIWFIYGICLVSFLYHKPILHLADRIALLRQSYIVFTHTYIFGTGLGGYVGIQARYFPTSSLFLKTQPVHIAPVLFFIESGILLTGIIVCVLYRARVFHSMGIWWILILGLADHYIWTQPQTLWLAGCFLTWYNMSLAQSSNGRITDSESVDLGSNPSRATSKNRSATDR